MTPISVKETNAAETERYDEHQMDEEVPVVDMEAQIEALIDTPSL